MCPVKLLEFFRYIEWLATGIFFDHARKIGEWLIHRGIVRHVTLYFTVGESQRAIRVRV